LKWKGLRICSTWRSTGPADVEIDDYPGANLLEEFLHPLNLGQTALARALHAPLRRVNEIVLGKRAVAADTDLRLTRYFALAPGHFSGLQADRDLMERRRELGPALELIAPRAA
jgi:addiction module HigA family antidote